MGTTHLGITLAWLLLASVMETGVLAEERTCYCSQTYVQNETCFSPVDASATPSPGETFDCVAKECDALRWNCDLAETEQLCVLEATLACEKQGNGFVAVEGTRARPRRSNNALGDQRPTIPSNSSSNSSNKDEPDPIPTQGVETDPILLVGKLYSPLSVDDTSFGRAVGISPSGQLLGIAGESHIHVYTPNGTGWEHVASFQAATDNSIPLGVGEDVIVSGTVAYWLRNGDWARQDLPTRCIPFFSPKPVLSGSRLALIGSGCVEVFVREASTWLFEQTIPTGDKYGGIGDFANDKIVLYGLNYECSEEPLSRALSLLGIDTDDVTCSQNGQHVVVDDVSSLVCYDLHRVYERNADGWAFSKNAPTLTHASVESASCSTPKGDLDPGQISLWADVIGFAGDLVYAAASKRPGGPITFYRDSSSSPDSWEYMGGPEIPDDFRLGPYEQLHGQPISSSQGTLLFKPSGQERVLVVEGGPANWKYKRALVPLDSEDTYGFGSSLAQAGNLVVVGAPGNPGSVYVRAL
mmetsp:Transcript_24062/g.58687  ORF Transcript_24062/g.58687 Transcript_24062/m.58687 type:complete len:525 (-) Transcript_24062:70-1644(-)|eukprot:CAMPEP_0198312014 /NCGR_PEP_ID=MMETSP1450-20131203/3560_1 /TAXON_ID=753684 ORGANISM="Madagascaria erythrocladiodes, Strain CCMP3234" /NCGR_SAMPLE_ID=MMETSP1450 /ASSEMBLY_ACC=CAM_ASM_001115 /LENGTH=524 /DNA_ID=CAMNT_0044014939 /DNA_START=18 /DNA_END=1592 /DNA_ORIENTATION=-